MPTPQLGHALASTFSYVRKFGDLHLLKMTVVPGNMLMPLVSLCDGLSRDAVCLRLRLDLLNKFQVGGRQFLKQRQCGSERDTGRLPPQRMVES